ncbi:unnamed protein product [Lactuca virosa]|uniref:Actin-related protein 4 n=1 Tax=Lactuca virosa TaxID=75947 RepID=A0AAU9PT11_9ASTR|nr:unnamed protein product [Lactuca virosa]
MQIFFNPEIYDKDFTTPLPAVIDSCIQSAPIDTGRALYNNLVLSGGSTMFKHFQRRLQLETKKIVDARVLASTARHDSEVKESVGNDKAFAVRNGYELHSNQEHHSSRKLFSYTPN